MMGVSCPANVGDDYNTIEDITTIDDANNFTAITHNQGEVLMIDFWATWCPPCQKPMAHNSEMIKEHGEAWGGKVRIIGVSIDKDAPTVQAHVEKNGWGNVEHYHRAKSSCSDDYKVQGVPHIVIVDTNGKIAFMGHPAHRKDLVADFNALLEGKTLEGVEAPKEGEGEIKPADAPENPADEDRFKAIMGEMDRFHNEIAPKLQKDHKETATGMIRNFCVMTLDAIFHPASQTWGAEYMNHRVLVGPKEKVDACNNAVKELMGSEENKGEKGFSFNINE